MASAAFSFCAMAENYFQVGMQWTVEHSSTALPTPEVSTEEIWLDQPIELQSWFPEGKEAEGMMTLWSCNLQNPEGKTFLAWIKTDGEKVYSIQAPRANFIPTDWTLLYDFGLSQEESCRVTPVVIGNNNPEQFASTVKCISFTTSSSNLILMNMQEDYDSSFTSNGTWIKGIGSTSGILDPNRFETDGGRSTLLQAKLNDHIIYSDPSLSGVKANPTTPQIYLEDHAIIINTDGTTTPVELIDANGNIVYRGICNGNSTIKPAQPGIHVVRIGDQSIKVIL